MGHLRCCQVKTILSEPYLIMSNHEVRTSGNVLRTLTTFITSLTFTKCKDFPLETRMRRCLVPIMLLLGALFLHYRILATLTVLMNTIETPPFPLMQGELLPLITRQRLKHGWTHIPLPKYATFITPILALRYFVLTLRSFT